MKFIIYHSKDLDGKASGAIAALYFQKDSPKLIGYHYDEPLDIEQFRDQDVLMADVTLSLEQTLEVARIARSFTLVDHHVSFFEKFSEYMVTNTTDELQFTEFTGLIKNYTFSGGINLNYYYSEKLSACEIMLQLYNVGNENTQNNVRLLGQYDTWRNTDEKKFTTDIAWEAVMNHQFGFRLADTIQGVQNFLMFSQQDHIGSGYNIRQYQRQINATAMERAFEFELNGLRIVACEGVQFNSTSFESIYNPEFHDAMMPFNYDGQQKIWNFSLYTTKPEADILSIAKDFGGGGHKQACGFQMPFDQVRLSEKEGIVFGQTVIMVDIAALPKGMSVNEFMEQLNKKATIKFEPVSAADNNEKIVAERDTYQAPATEEKFAQIPPPPPVKDEIKTIPGLTDTDDLDSIGLSKESEKEQAKPNDIASAKPAQNKTAKPSNAKKKSNGNKK